MHFELTDKEVLQVLEWSRAQDKIVAKRQNKKEAYYGAIGGALTYCFTPTSVGVVVKVKHALTDSELDITDYNSW